MQIRRVRLIYRKSFYQLFVEERPEQPLLRALRRGDPAARAFADSHQANLEALDQTVAALETLGVEVAVRPYRQLNSTRHIDMVISLGGDGTLMSTSWEVRDRTPVLGINSDPNRSVGALCAGTVADLPRLVEALRSGRLRPRPHNRLRVRLEGEEVLGPVLNDVLFAHDVPAGLSRFDLALVPAERAEQPGPEQGADLVRQRGSGIWVATAAGSTAAIRSAGGAVMPPLSRKLQYLVREPFNHPVNGRASRVRGEVRPQQALLLISRMRRGTLWADGAEHSHEVTFGQRILLDNHPQPLYLVRP